MDSESTSPTQGSNQEGYIPVSSSADIRREPSTTEISERDKFGIQYIKPLLESLQDNLAFTGVLTGIIGYIIISAFGHMDSMSAYFRYVIFLLLNFVLYKFLAKNRIEIDFKNINLFLILGFLTLLVFIIIEHNLFILTWNYVTDVFSKK